ncbi:GNAT family N-acetyltransferase [Prosthecomicrobium hirschii]|uniref:GNAT family N-acetyltransferase n=1 Tax=Prosthecodimorpha hirschii TaxID=665126 RepID=UPI0011291EFD|nr:GNAT family N-acetyltransferase [Prosthecomicrobium hirschii]TPQ47142.1 GNAT family N-acetyltransferase [Prosthecomicrobium hirschii]
MSPPSYTVAPVRTPDDLAAAIVLIRAYAASLPIDLGYQGFEAEMAGMPGKYAPPDGELLLARAADGTPLGCVGLRPLPPVDGRAEMKRLYVVPAARGTGLGDALARAVIAAAVRLGYREMVLDTLPSMTGAQAVYRKYGFVEIGPYYETPIAGTVFMRCELVPPEAVPPARG